MLEFINALNESSVVYVLDVRAYGWHWIPGSPVDGWEAVSPFGEVKCFATREDAQRWRLAEVREYVR